MSKYEPLWVYVENNGGHAVRLSFGEIRDILGFPIDHSFLQYKKELQEFGYRVGKISRKEKYVIFLKVNKK